MNFDSPSAAAALGLPVLGDMSLDVGHMGLGITRGSEDDQKVKLAHIQEILKVGLGAKLGRMQVN